MRLIVPVLIAAVMLPVIVHAQRAAVQTPVLQGYSVVAMVQQDKLVEGKVDFSASFRGRLFFFANADEQASFQADPSAYTSQAGPRYRALLNDVALGGYCPVAAVDSQTVTPGQAGLSVTYKYREYRLSTPAAKAKFEADPDAYASKANAALNAAMAAAKVVEAPPEPQPVAADATEEAAPADATPEPEQKAPAKKDGKKKKPQN